MGVLEPPDVKHVGTEEWLKTAAKLLCFRPEGGEEGTKATLEDLHACVLPPNHVGRCAYTNASQIERVVAQEAGIRP